MRPASTQALTFRYVLVLLLIALLALVAYLTLNRVIFKGRQLLESRDSGGPQGEGWRKFAGAVRGLPSDMALNHDHYLHGLPKK